MNLNFTPEQDAFRTEIREWLAANVPDKPLVTLECEEGFHQHVEWERRLASGNWGMVTWPEAVGGRGLDLIEWLIFEEEYWSAGAQICFFGKLPLRAANIIIDPQQDAECEIYQSCGKRDHARSLSLYEQTCDCCHGQNGQHHGKDGKTAHYISTHVIAATSPRSMISA